MKTFSFEWLASQALALVPLAVGLIFGALILPRSVPPEEIPAPILDARLLARTAAEDDTRAARVNSAPLSSRVRAVGSGFRAFNDAEGRHGDEATISHARDMLWKALRDTTDADTEPLLDLRAYHLSQFLTEARRYERTGEVSDELLQVGGTFVERMEKVGWCSQHRLAMAEEARRAAFKATWNRLLGLDASPRFALTLDEYRALYAFYFSHPHASEAERARIDVVLQRAPDVAGQERAVAATKKATANWLIGKIGELAKIDPSYPADLARGAALFLRQDYRGSAAIYQNWLDRHPSGLWTLRVQNHLRAAGLAAERELQ
jgi:hypothetical protein